MDPSKCNDVAFFSAPAQTDFSYPYIARGALPAQPSTACRSNQTNGFYDRCSLGLQQACVIPKRPCSMDFRAKSPTILLFKQPCPFSKKFPFAEERRLFYLVLTKARSGAFMFRLEFRRSAFLIELAKKGASPQSIRMESRPHLSPARYFETLKTAQAPEHVRECDLQEALASLLS